MVLALRRRGVDWFVRVCVLDVGALLAARFGSQRKRSSYSGPVANLVAWPLAWYFLSDWLDGFVYRIDLNATYFILAGMAALVIAWATVAYHAWRVAQSNPIHALRHE